MHHRLRTLHEQRNAAQTPGLRALYDTNIEQVTHMLAREPVPRDDRSYQRELAAQIVALDTPPSSFTAAPR
jgi:hypothetical protein